LRRDSIIEAVVKLGNEQPRLLCLPEYDPDRTTVNGLVLMHALQHLDEPRLTRPGDQMSGNHERRAFALNAATLFAIDDEGFNSYVNSVPIELHTATSPDDPDVYESVDNTKAWAPPKGSKLERIMAQNPTAETVVRVTAIMTSLGRQAVDRGLTEQHSEHYLGWRYRVSRVTGDISDTE
jgi:hypothetical protein